MNSSGGSDSVPVLLSSCGVIVAVTGGFSVPGQQVEKVMRVGIADLLISAIDFQLQ